MKPLRRGTVIGCTAAGGVFAVIVVVAFWWLFLRGGAVVDRLDFVGPQTQAFVTFLAEPGDRPLKEVVDSLKRRAPPAGPPAGDRRAEWMRWAGDLLSGALTDHVRASALVETTEDGRSQVGFVVSLGKMAKMVVRMWLGFTDSERETETYRRERIILGRERSDFSMAFVGSNLILSRDPRIVKILIDRVKGATLSAKPSESLAAVLRDVDPRREMPGYGALVNDRASLASIWQELTGAPEGSGIALPDSFQGVGFRFGFSSADALHGDGYFYFGDEEAAAGGQRQLETAIMTMFSHLRLTPDVAIEQEGSRLHVTVEAQGVQAAIDHFTTKAR